MMVSINPINNYKNSTMNNINIHYKKYRYSFKENTFCFIAGICCICLLLYLGILLYPLAAKVFEYLNRGVEAINSAIRGCYR